MFIVAVWSSNSKPLALGCATPMGFVWHCQMIWELTPGNSLSVHTGPCWHCQSLDRPRKLLSCSKSACLCGPCKEKIQGDWQSKLDPQSPVFFSFANILVRTCCGPLPGSHQPCPTKMVPSCKTMQRILASQLLAWQESTLRGENKSRIKSHNLQRTAPAHWDGTGFYWPSLR